MGNYRTKFEENKSKVINEFDNLIAFEEQIKADFKDLINVEEELSNIKELKEKFSDKTFEIVVVGEFSTGKSTFINALMKKNVLPSKATPTTATINYLKHSDLNNGKEEAKVYLFNGEVKIVNHENITEYTVEMSNKYNVSNEIKHIDIFIDSDYLKDGVVIVDTPGLSALNEEHIKITYNKMKTSQASIILFSSEQAGRKTEFEFLSDLKNYIDRMFFVVNRIDTTAPEELNEVLGNLQDNLLTNKYVKLNPDDVTLYPISSLQALMSYDSSLNTHFDWGKYSSQQLLELSRFPTFEKRLEKYLFDGEKINDEVSSANKSVLTHYSLLLNKIEDIKITLNTQNIELMEKELNKLKIEVKSLETQLKKSVVGISNEVEDLKEASIKDMKLKLKNAKNHIETFIEDAEDENELEEVTNEELEMYTNDMNEVFNEELKEYSKKVNEKLTNVYDGLKYEIKQQNMDLNDKRRKIEVKDIEVNKSLFQGEEIEDFQRQREELKEARNEVNALNKVRRDKEQLESEIKRLKDKNTTEESFFNSLYAHVSPKKKVKVKKLFRSKNEEVDNEKYAEIQEEKKKRHLEFLSVIDEKESELANKIREEKEMEFNAEYLSLTDIKEAGKGISESEKAFIQHTRVEEEKKYLKALKREKRKVKREVEKISNEYFKEYREVLEGLNTLEFVKNQIQQYIEKENEDLQKRKSEMEEKAKLINETKDEQKRIENLVNDYETEIFNRNLNLQEV